MTCKNPYTTCKQLALALRILFFVATGITPAYSQSDTLPYQDASRQRLLIRITAHYLHTVSQGQIDMDSAIRIPCRLYGLSPLLAYNEGYSDGKPSAGTRLLDAGKVAEARALLAGLHNEARLRLLIELGSYFVFKPGTDKADLAAASTYINEAVTLSSTQSIKWRMESLTAQAHLLSQSALDKESEQVFDQVLALGEHSGDTLAFARALLDAGRLLPYGHPLKLRRFEKALSIFNSNQAKEKEIETLSEINVEHFVFKHYDLVEKYTLRIIALQTQIHFYHQHFAYNALSYVITRKSDLPRALFYTNKSLESLRSRADSAFINLFYISKGNLYTVLNKNDEALFWYGKALENRSAETRLYWYNAFIGKARLLAFTGKAAEALTLVQEIGSRFPPITPYEKMYYTLSLGSANEMLGKLALAEENYNEFLAIAKHFPPEYVHDEFPNALLDISAFYLDHGKINKSKEVLAGINPDPYGPSGKGTYYLHRFLIDSSEKRYISAIQNLRLSHKFADSAYNIDQRKKVEELLVQYEAEKKDKNIQLLTRQTESQNTRLQQSRFMQRITFAGTALLLLIAALLYYLYQTKQKSNTQLKQLLGEKEWLIREVHHRVKNNLQMVTSLLSTQSAYLEDYAAVLAVKDSLRRMHAMSLIHQKLYQTDNISSIAMPEYIDELVTFLHDSFDTGNRIVFEQTIAPLHFDVTQAIPLGLIINESVVNAIKYAFPNGRKGIVHISLQHDGKDHLLLKISDDGIGLPPDFDIGKHNSLGLDLIQWLTKQLNGSFSIENNNGVQLMLRFKSLYH